jgi:hypothetical protein
MDSSHLALVFTFLQPWFFWVVFVAIVLGLARLQGCKPPELWFLGSGLYGLVLQQFSGKFNKFSFLLLLFATFPFLLPTAKDIASWISKNIKEISWGDKRIILHVEESIAEEIRISAQKMNGMEFKTLLEQLPDVSSEWKRSLRSDSAEIFMSDYIKKNVGIGNND